jgi:hypothetical protein
MGQMGFLGPGGGLPLAQQLFGGVMPMFSHDDDELGAVLVDDDQAPEDADDDGDEDGLPSLDSLDYDDSGSQYQTASEADMY